MSRKHLFVLNVLFFLPLCFGQQTEIHYLSGTDKDHTVEWDFFCTGGRNSGKWSTIPVPSCWELQGFGTYNYGHDKNKGDEQGRYRREFSASSTWKGRRAFIVFEAVMTDTEVSINGKPAGPKHQGSFFEFRYEITDLIRFDRPNLLEVTVHKTSSDPTINDAERTSDYWVFGGIFRPVYLEIQPPQFIERTTLDARADGNLTAEVFLSNITTATRLSAQIRSLDGEPLGSAVTTSVSNGVSRVRVEARLENPALWTAETPNLYLLDLRLKSDTADCHHLVQRFGFRTIEFRPGDGFYLNGGKIRLKGTNRHSFWPDSGRTTSKQLSRSDVQLIKEMNMNAVRMSHYPPDKHFLDVCDEVGLYVVDEFPGWQQKYGTEIGEKLIREMIVRDVNHPSIIIWSNADERGWNTELDDDFHKWDPQKRQVIHPDESFNGTDTSHYPEYGCCPGKFFNGSEVFFPTELLHGLYDGGLGASLNDYWDLILSKPNGAGAFLWVLFDEAVKRTDKNGTLDTDGNHGPDGILGPYREKEASFFTIKEIWSPVYVAMRELPPGFDGTIPIENRYDFTSLGKCRFEWKLADFRGPFEAETGFRVVNSGSLAAPDLQPWTKGAVKVPLPSGWRDHDMLALTAWDWNARELFTWTWPLRPPEASLRRFLKTGLGVVEARESADEVTLQASSVQARFDKKSGLLKGVSVAGKPLSLANGPAPVVGSAQPAGSKLHKAGDVWTLETGFTGGAMRSARWTMYPSGWLKLEYSYEASGPQDWLGVSFDYPEPNVKAMRWLGRGPYRVWKNRLKGGTLNVWRKNYNATRTGASWDYPEFKGVHSDFYWAVIETTETPFLVATDRPNRFFRVLTPDYGEEPLFTAVTFPTGSFSFLDGIAPVGNKFHGTHQLGPEAAPNQAKGVYEGTLYFYFGVDGVR